MAVRRFPSLVHDGRSDVVQASRTPDSLILSLEAKPFSSSSFDLLDIKHKCRWTDLQDLSSFGDETQQCLLSFLFLPQRVRRVRHASRHDSAATLLCFDSWRGTDQQMVTAQ